MQFLGKADEYLLLQAITADNCHLLKAHIESSLSILWNQEAGTTLLVDGVSHTLAKNQLIFLTEFHQVKVLKVNTIRLIKFNKPFYCILDHDNEVSCKGLLFFGASRLPSIHLPKEEEEKFETLWNMFRLEMQSRDSLQIEMLQMMLKRLIILCTRISKEQNQQDGLEVSSLDLIREFNFLVETHFKSKHTVAEYAALLNKSPKTLSNFFAKNHDKTPLQIIQERILMEARRQLAHTDEAVKIIAYEVGFDSIQSFSRFFKSKEGVSPNDFRKRIREKVLS
ncbi:MAG: helix-turn-helix domain-containing protein [Bacteroidota bacterium]